MAARANDRHGFGNDLVRLRRSDTGSRCVISGALQRRRNSRVGRRLRQRRIIAFGHDGNHDLLVRLQRAANDVFQSGPIRPGKIIDITADSLHASSLRRTASKANQIRLPMHHPAAALRIRIQ
ncbi:MAG TPA: hypothetical protein VFV87_14715 [Pirellulaceae bacterium]|nr:hypothetical protein [Pirellulaceae bacterium]